MLRMRKLTYSLLILTIVLAPCTSTAQQQRQVTFEASVVQNGRDGVPVFVVPRNEAIERIDKDLKDAINQLRVERRGRQQLQRVTDKSLLSTIDGNELMAAMDRAFEISKKRDAVTSKQTPTYLLLSPANVIGELADFGPIIDELLNKVDALATSQLFSMRSHLTATIADLNVVFKNRMNDAFDELDKVQKQVLRDAQVLISDTNRALTELQDKTFTAAANALCDTSALLANFPIKLISINLRKQKVLPDIVCLKSPNIRDSGSLHEQLLQFRGVNLNADEEYPVATLTIPSQPQVNYTLNTAGGNSVLLMPLPGGLNGTFDDTKLRGDLITQVDFNWRTAGKLRRWFFILKPFIVRSIDVSITPEIEHSV